MSVMKTLFASAVSLATLFTIPAPTAADYTFRTSPVPGTAPAEGTTSP